MIIPAKELIIKHAPLSAVRKFVEENHYSHSVNGVKIAHCFSVTHNGVLVGAVVYGAMSTTAWMKFARLEEEVLELRRLVLVDEAGRNSESYVVGWTIRWLRKHRPGVKVVVSYADPAYGHCGTIYKAANFTYRGMTAKDKAFVTPEGKVYHSRALRTRDDWGEYKPFVKKLRKMKDDGLLKEVVLPGKHCFTYEMSGRKSR